MFSKQVGRSDVAGCQGARRTGEWGDKGGGGGCKEESGAGSETKAEENS